MENKAAQIKQPVLLTIAGLDPSGGAGVLADVQTFSAFGCFATAAITSLTFQNTTGVFGASHQSAENVRNQIAPIIKDLKVAGIKTGMLPSADVIREIAGLLSEHNLPRPVVDPVVRSTSGYDLIDGESLKALIKHLFPLSRLITPNLPEAERITGLTIKTDPDIEKAARAMQEMGAENVLIKGGHFQGSEMATDFLFEGDRMIAFSEPWIDTDATHGTGCTLSAAIAANLALGHSLEISISIAKKFVTEAIRNAPAIGHGHSPVNHSLKQTGS
ncbi:MAG TPA: bifunctional hydroxymethylpyrimidine kinase/phosphomethylpyrimidine kinase [Pyrinomonadaceae bacterium]|nr:bifunctional hydroxymethylpyrimidine kinase/phosphomethylpyrimidine kinase [Pyrinomonadaceae bacterium]